MADVKPTDEQTNAFVLRITLRGGVADLGRVEAADYAAAIAGWNEYFTLAADLFFLGPQGASEARPPRSLRISVEARRRGSHVTELIVEYGPTVAAFVAVTAVGGVIGNRSDAVLVAAWPRLKAWFAKLFRSHVDQKRRTTSVADVITNLERLIRQENLPVALQRTDEAAEAPLIAHTLVGEPSQPNEPLPQPPENLPFSRRIANSIDASLSQATRPLISECDVIEITADATEILLVVTGSDRSAIIAPLIPLVPDDEWQPADVALVRVNRRTGGVIFYFATDPPGQAENYYAQVIDAEIRRPNNAYTTAFNDDRPMPVWLKAVPRPGAQAGLQYRITRHRPDEQLLMTFDKSESA